MRPIAYSLRSTVYTEDRSNPLNEIPVPYLRGLERHHRVSSAMWKTAKAATRTATRAKERRDEPGVEELPEGASIEFTKVSTVSMLAVFINKESVVCYILSGCSKVCSRDRVHD